MYCLMKIKFIIQLNSSARYSIHLPCLHDYMINILTQNGNYATCSYFYDISIFSVKLMLKWGDWPILSTPFRN
jgi:hypothetical protein